MSTQPESSPAPRTVPVIEEHLEVERRETETGAVRVRIETTESRQSLQLEAWRESVEVERVPVNRPVAEREGPRQDGDVLVVPVYEEQVVVQRTWVLREEWHLRRRREVTTEPVEVSLQREQARIERREGDGPWHEAGDNEAMRAPPASSPAFKKES